MARLTINKCCGCIGLRRSAKSCACMFLLIKARYLYQGIITFIGYMSYYSRYELTLEYKVQSVYGFFRNLINVIDVILVILLFIGLFDIKKIKYVRLFYRGVLSTTIINSIAYALLITLHITVFKTYENLAKKDPNAKYLYLYVIAEKTIYAVMVLIFVLVTRSYYYSVIEEKEETEVDVNLEKLDTHV